MHGLHGGLHGLDEAVGGGGSAPAGLPEQDFVIVDGVTIAVGDCVAITPSFAGTAAGRATLADARFATLRPWFVGVALTGGTGDAAGSVSCTVQLLGPYTDAGAAFTAGKLYLSVTGTGRPVNTIPSGAGNQWVEVGYAVSSTVWHVLPGANIAL